LNVNLSTKQCSDPELIHRIIDILKKHELEASSLKLELTESLIVEDTDFIASILQNLRDLGIQVQIDDFGTGYSSLGYLHTLPIETLKVDRTFISQLGQSSNGLEIVRTILALAHSLGMQVIAEGVETEEQLQKLKKLNCEYVQGFYFSEPVDSEKVDKLLRKSSSGRKS
jgi:EAL domain-containing protein (putative c-di-GMP-specific phosphodiesterase class I)